MGDAVLIQCTNTVTPAVASPPTKASITTTYKVIGFKTNPKPCRLNLVIFEVVIGGTSVSLVWDAANNIICKEPVVTSDETYQAWYAAQKAQTTSDMFPSLTSSGANNLDDEYRNWILEGVSWTYSEQPTRCPQLAPGEIDWETWIILRDLGGLVKDAEFSQHMSAQQSEYFRFGPGSLWALINCTEYCTCPIPSPFTTGFRLKHDFDNYYKNDPWHIGPYDGVYQYGRTWYFPYGDPIVISGTEDWSGTDYLYTQPVSIQASIYGKYTDYVIANAFIAQYQMERYYGDWHSEADTNGFHVYAQTLYNEDGILTTDWRAQGRNTALESKISEAAALAYSIRGAGGSTIPYLGWCTINITIL